MLRDASDVRHPEGHTSERIVFFGKVSGQCVMPRPADVGRR